MGPSFPETTFFSGSVEIPQYCGVPMICGYKAGSFARASFRIISPLSRPTE